MNENNPLRVRFDRFRLDEAEARLERDGEPVNLAPRAFQVLSELIRRAGHLVSKDVLLDAVWGHRHVNEAVLKNIVSQLRQALGDDPRQPAYVETVARRGYRFIAPVVGRAAAAASVPRSTPEAGDWLVGRSAVLAQMQAALAAARQGQRQLLFVVGEAGIGKSSLLERFAASAGVRLAFGQCAEHFGDAEPYLPVLEALNGLCRADDGAGLVALMRQVAPTWLLQLPWFLTGEDRQALQHEAAGATQDRMLREFGEFVDRLTHEQPLLLLLEDLHWSDHATVQLIAYLARRRGLGALMLVVSFRPTELILQEHPLAALRQQLRPRRMCMEIDLEFLAETELGEYLQARLGTPAPESFVRSLHTHTLGLPLFVSAVVEELLAAGELVESVSGWRFPALDRLHVPRSIAGLIESQIARLSLDQQRALGAASVCGVEFLHLPLAEVLQLPADELQAQLEAASPRLPWLRCEGARVVTGGRIAARYRFAHSVYRQTLYEGLTALQRLQWHRRWASALEALHASATADVAAELAMHFERGDAPAEAASQLAIVAARAMASGAPREALQAALNGQRLLALCGASTNPHLEQELRSLEAVALTRELVMAAPEVVGAFARARELGPVNSRAWQRTLQGCWWVHFTRAEYGAARALAAEMLDLAEQRADVALRLAGLNALGTVQMICGEFIAARTSLERAVQDHAGMPSTLVPTHFVHDPGIEAMLTLTLAYWMTGEPRRARTLAEQALARAASSRHPLSEAAALYAVSLLHALSGEFATVLALTERLNLLVQEHELPERISGFAWLHGRALIDHGRVDEGFAEMKAAAESARRLGLRNGTAGFHYHHAQACLQVGRIEEAEASVGAGLAFSRDSGAGIVLAPLLGLSAQLDWEKGNRSEAIATWGQAFLAARARGSAFQELQVLATAQAHGANVADPDRLRRVLDLYAGDPSPIVLHALSLAYEQVGAVPNSAQTTVGLRSTRN